LQEIGQHRVRRVTTPNLFLNILLFLLNAVTDNAVSVITYAPNLLKYFDWVYDNSTSIYLRDGSEVAKSRRGEIPSVLYSFPFLQAVLANSTEPNVPVDAYAIWMI
jgi:hypothetical protein